jgi:thiosulfate dehydrogenase (quinone) large subunit
MKNFDAVLGYTVLRVAFGVDVLMHGVSRLIGGVGHFAEPVIKQFAATILPEALVVPFVYAIPYIETCLGALVLIGLWTRWTLVGLGAMMTALIFGTALRQDWATVSTQLPYPVVLFLLLATIGWNTISIDGALRRRAGSPSLPY